MTTKWTVSIVLQGYGTQSYPYTIDSLGYYLNTILLCVNHILFKITLITFDFHTMTTIKLQIK